jgi:hypothetical protein
LGTTDPESILRRFTRTACQQPFYQTIIELGKVYWTIFVCDYLCPEALRREIHAGKNVIEKWNSANGFIFYGREEQDRDEPIGRSGNGDALPAPVADLPGLRQHPAGPTSAGRATVG